MENRPGLYLLDAYALIYRSYYAFINSQMFNSKGLNTSTIFGFAIVLEELIRSRKPEYLAVVFDPGGLTFRHNMYPAYKANRDETPEVIRQSVPEIKRMIEAMNIPVLQLDGFEADDLIGTLAKKAEAAGYDVFMMTPDKDYGQLVDSFIHMYKPAKAGNPPELWGVDEICAKYSIKTPMQVIDILALMGDASDNIPGAPGVGEKTAIKLISEYGSVENLLENTSKLKGKQKETIEQYADQIRLSKQLVTIDTNVPIDFEADKMKFTGYHDTAFKAILEEFDFKSLIKRFFAEAPQPKPVAPSAVSAGPRQGSLFDMAPQELPQTPATSSRYETIQSVAHTYYTLTEPVDLQQLADKLQTINEFCFDTETTGLNPHQDQLVGLSLAFKPFEAYYIPLPANAAQCRSVLSYFAPAFANAQIRKIGQNIKFDLLFLQRYGIDINGELFDTMLAHYLLQPEQSHKMDSLSQKYLNYTPVSIEELIGKKGAGQLNMSSVPLNLIAEYAAEDADITLQLQKKLEPELQANGFSELFTNLETPLLRVLADMEATGVTIDIDALREFAVLLRQQIITVEDEIYTLAGQPFNIASPKQLGEILFDKLQISDVLKKTKTKQYSTDEEVLAGLASKHPIAGKVLEYRGLTKLLNTYVEALPKLVNPRTGKIHTSFNQAVTATGRLSSTNPNLQNIPIREEQGREIRKAFTASSSDRVVISADYSQVELRLMAHLSGDPAMIEAFKNNADIHTATAAGIYKIPFNEVTREQRSRAKTANFGIIYGISAFGLSQRLGISRVEANELIEGYFLNYPNVRTYMSNAILSARDKGYVETLLGRRRYLPDIHSANQTVRGNAERNAINAPIQGTAADLIKMAMVNIYHRLTEQKLEAKMILQVHDELVFDVPKNEIEKVSEIIKTEMENVYPLSVPLTTELGVGKNWLEAH